MRFWVGVSQYYQSQSMITAGIESEIRNILAKQLAISVTSVRFETVGGGSINDAYRLVINNNILLFCKLNSVEKFPFFFEKEKRGIELLGNQNIIRIPKIVVCENLDHFQVLIMEWI